MRSLAERRLVPAAGEGLDTPRGSDAARCGGPRDRKQRANRVGLVEKPCVTCGALVDERSMKDRRQALAFLSLLWPVRGTSGPTSIILSSTRKACGRPARSQQRRHQRHSVTHAVVMGFCA